ncbi:MAG: hypothetical protein JRN52_02565 [Nitrososphaerota archaeon]|nr:hypothetical protein [Nitrososphaerota archaeon]
MSTDSLPKWIAEEIREAKFDREEEWTGSGYILDINKKDAKIDVQFYEKLPEGRYIATLDLPSKFDIDSLELAVVYMFKFKSFKASLSEKAVTFLKEKYGLTMDGVYRFVLISLEKLDAEADSPPRRSEEESEEEE